MAHQRHGMRLISLGLYKVHGYGAIHCYDRPVRWGILPRHLIFIYILSMVKINHMSEEYTSINF